MNSWQSPVASEPSLGTPHPSIRAASSWTLSARTETRAAPYTWDLGALGLPVGANRVEIHLVGSVNNTLATAGEEITAWDYDAGADSAVNQTRIGLTVRTPYKPASAANQLAHAGLRAFIQIGTSRKLYIGSAANNIPWYAEYCGYDS
jgi:hypothetical protein